MRRRIGPTPRAGYTLVELLVVIAIIAILAGLLTSALTKVRRSAKITAAVSEINQLDAALTAFDQKHSFYPPSHVGYTDGSGQPQIGMFRIPTQVYDPSMPLTDDQKRELASLNVLRKMFPRWNPGNVGATITPALTVPTSDGTPTGTPIQDLDPNQVMVYFLGGPAALLDPSKSGLNPGWDNARPYPPLGQTRIDPYYGDFNTARMTDPATGKYDGRYRDPWGTPYAYFAANAGTDQYDARAQFPWASNPAPASFTPSSDPNALTTNTAHPLASSVSGTSVRWFNPKRVQIISAGPNKKFGHGSYRSSPTGSPTAWNPTQQDPNEMQPPAAKGGYTEAEAGEDDLANFNAGTALGAQGSST